MPNAVLHTDLQLLTIRAEITRMNGKYKAKLEAQPNDLAQILCIPHTLGRISKVTSWIYRNGSSTRLLLPNGDGPLGRISSRPIWTPLEGAQCVSLYMPVLVV